MLPKTGRRGEVRRCFLLRILVAFSFIQSWYIPFFSFASARLGGGYFFAGYYWPGWPPRLKRHPGKRPWKNDRTCGGSNDLAYIVRNNTGEALDIGLFVEKLGGSWKSAGMAADLASGDATTDFWGCGPTGCHIAFYRRADSNDYLPDTDGDTVSDPADACPLTPGLPANKGCPALKAEEIKVLKTAFANLAFETGRDVIRPQSLPAFQELAALLVARPAFRLRLTGYTDNVGPAPANLLLSRQRAAAVRRYLVRRAAPAAHIRAEGFGRARPVGTNKTAAGRARNRRVEMKVLFD